LGWLVAWGCIGALALAATDRPVVGIVSLPPDGARCITTESIGETPGVKGRATSCFHALYVKWLEQAGLRVAPVRFDAPRRELERLFRSLNGLLFTGGETVIWDTNSTFDDTARWLLQRAIAANQAGDYFPVWGTCQGFQLLSVLVAQDPAVLKVEAFTPVEYMIPLNLTAAAMHSRLLGSDTLRRQLSTQPVTYNAHRNGVSPSTYATNPRLASFFRVLSTNVDPDGRPFVSTVEGIDDPIYGVQWHPERPQFAWGPGSDAVLHPPAAVEPMQALASFLATEARKSTHRFATPTEEAAALIYNWSPVGRNSYLWYLFDRSTDHLGDPR